MRQQMEEEQWDLCRLLDAEKDDTPVDIEDTELLLPEVYAEQEDLSRRLGKIIDSLSDVQRQAVMLFYFDQLSVDEIAQVMECSTGTVKSRLFLARKTIRTEIEEQERKSGQKFYGIAGIPMLGLSEIFARQAEAFSLPSSTAGNILERISSTIAQEATSAAQSAAAGNTKELAAMLSGLMKSPEGMAVMNRINDSAKK